MKADYEKHKDTGKHELNMTSVYFPCDTQAPSEYGIIVVDFPDKKIYSSQDYFNISSLAFYNVWSRWEDYSEEELAEDETYQEFTQLFQEVFSEPFVLPED